MAMFFLICGVVILICMASGRLLERTGMPSLLIFMVVGMLFGSDGILKIPFDNYDVADMICRLALVFIMFYGGFGTKLSAARPVLGRSICLSTLGVVLTAGITALCCHLFLRMAWLESFLIGSVISSTDAASVFSILRSKKLDLKDNLASVLEVESGSNDPVSYMLTAIVLTLMTTSDTSSVGGMLFTQVVFGLMLGFGVGFGAVWLLKKRGIFKNGMETIFLIGMVLLMYAVAELIQANGYLSLYIAGIIIGNADIKNKPAMVNFFDGITDLAQIMLFFLLGLLAFPSQMPSVILPAAVIMIILTFIARPLTVFAVLTPFRVGFKQQLFVAFAGLRGAASVTFAIMVMISGANIGYDVFHIVFCVCLLSVAFQGTLLPLAAKKLGLIDSNANVLKTFNDYREEAEMHMMKINITQNHHWKGKKIKDIELPPDSLVLIIKRGKENIIPNGETLIEENDTLMLSITACEADSDFVLREITIGKHHKWRDKSIRDISFPEGVLAVMIKRGSNTIIPNGDTIVQKNDVVVVNNI